MKRIVQLQFYANVRIDCLSVIYCIGLWKAKHEPPVVSTQSDDEMSEIKQQTKSKITFSAKQNKTQWIRKIKNKRIDEKKDDFFIWHVFFLQFFTKKEKQNTTERLSFFCCSSQLFLPIGLRLCCCSSMSLDIFCYLCYCFIYCTNLIRQKKTVERECVCVSIRRNRNIEIKEAHQMHPKIQCKNTTHLKFMCSMLNASQCNAKRTADLKINVSKYCNVSNGRKTINFF